ncbi:MAG: LamG domain-containing protein, partial [Myxococcota bacterium]
YITSTFALGTLSLFSAGQPVRYLSGTQGGYTALGTQVSSSNVTLAIMERGDTLTPTGTAAGRRVYLPWGNTGVNINQLSASGTTMLKRSIEWSLLPVSHWKCDEGSGSVVSDWIGGRTGTCSGPSWTTGKLAGALQYNGTTDYVSVADHGAFHVTSTMTITGWVRGTAWPSDPDWACTILRKGDVNPNNWELCIGLGKVAFVLDDYDAYAIRGNTTLPLNTWCHAAATWDGSKVRLYLNGVLDNTPYTRAAPIGTDTRNVYIGGRTGSTDIFPGRVDDVRFYNRCLTAAEIAALAKTSPTVMTWQEVSPP